LNLTVRPRISETCTGASVRITWLQTPPQNFARWRDYFSQLLNAHGVNDVGQRETHTAEPLVPEPSASEVELAIEQPKGTNLKVLMKSQ